jgi:hypothetical protein
VKCRFSVTLYSSLGANFPFPLTHFPGVMERVILSFLVLVRHFLLCDSVVSILSDGVANVAKAETNKSGIQGKTSFGKDRRRKHHHYLVSVFYADGEKFGRVYTDKDKATRFAERQRRSPVVKSARITQVS